MKFDDFCKVVGILYDELPNTIKDRFSISVEENPTEASKKLGIPFGYWHNLTPSNLTLCYWGFKKNADEGGIGFDEDHIRRVIKHEFEHILMGLKHSEHVKGKDYF